MHRLCLPVLALGLAAAACTASAVDVEPPQYELYFPTGMTTSPDEKYLFVVNANSDLRYSAGSVQALDLDQVDVVAAAWKNGQAPEGCEPIPTRPQVLGCALDIDGPEPVPQIMVRGASAQIGNFGTGIVVQPLATEEGGPLSSLLRLFVTVRGDPSVTWMDFDAATGMVSCSEGDGFPRCDESHRLARMRNDAAFPGLTPEPFYLALDDAGHVFVTHFTSGFVTLVSAPAIVGASPLLVDTITSLWAPTRTQGLAGAAGIAPRPTDPSGLVYVASRQEARVALIAVAPGPPDDKDRPTDQLVRTGSFLLSGIEQSGLQGDMRSILFTEDGNQAYMISRTPPSLQLFDTALDATGLPRNQLLNIVELCDQPANLAVANFGAGRIIAVPCFANGQVWLFDAATLRLLAIEESGRGPSGVAVSGARKKIYVGNYAEDTLTVIDVDPTSLNRNRAILRLGRPRPLEQR